MPSADQKTQATVYFIIRVHLFQWGRTCVSCVPFEMVTSFMSQDILNQNWNGCASLSSVSSLV